MNESVSVDVTLTHVYISEISFYYMYDSVCLNIRYFENIIVRFIYIYIYNAIAKVHENKSSNATIVCTSVLCFL